MRLGNAFKCTLGSSYTLLIGDLLLLLPPTITNRFGNDSVELVLVNANLKECSNGRMNCWFAHRTTQLNYVDYKSQIKILLGFWLFLNCDYMEIIWI